MNEAAAPESAVWTTVAVDVPVQQVLAHCRNVEMLLRLNPYLEVRAWSESPGEFGPGKRYRIEALNEWTGITRTLDLVVEQAGADGFRLAYSEGYKHALEVRVAPHGPGSALTLKEHYREADSGAGAALVAEIDRSVMPWAAAVRRDLHRLRRWGGVPGFSRLRRFWIGMKPRERRIGRMLVWVTVLEFVVFLFVFAIYWNEASR